MIVKHIGLQTIIYIKELYFLNNGLTTLYLRGKENVIIHFVSKWGWPLPGAVGCLAGVKIDWQGSCELDKPVD